MISAIATYHDQPPFEAAPSIVKRAKEFNDSEPVVNIIKYFEELIDSEQIYGSITTIEIHRIKKQCSTPDSTDDKNFRIGSEPINERR